MKPTHWIREYDLEKKNKFSEMFDSNAKALINDPKFFKTYEDKMPIRMKMKFIFYEIPCWEYLKIIQLLDPMHIFKNVSSSLWRHISSKKSDTLIVRRDLIYSNTKKKH